MNRVNRTLATLEEDYDGFWKANATTEYLLNANTSSIDNATFDDHHPSDVLASSQWVFLSLLIIPVWMLGGNLLVILTVLYQRNLQNLSNRVIASLAFTDLLLGLLVVPLSVYQLIQGSWQLGFPVCLIWTGSDVILSTASIMHLCAIALYRYHGIAHPLHVRSYATQGRHVTVLVVPAWTIAVALSVPFVAQGILNKSYVLQPLEATPDGLTRSPLQCGIFNQTFAVYSSLVSFFIPLAIMIFADIRSIQILRKNIQIPLLFNYSYFQRRRLAGISPVETPVEVIGPETPSCTNGIRVTSASRHLVPSTTLTSQDSMTTAEGSHGTSSEIALLSPTSSKGMTSFIVDPMSRSRSRSRSMVYLDMLASCGKMKVNGRERRAEKTLIWVFASFVVLWLPFFCTNLAYGLCGDRCSIPGELFQVFTWLGYLSSGVNPCIYTLLNKDFRTAFRNLLLCKHEKLTRTTRSFGFASSSNGTLRAINITEAAQK